jgi:branched-chain amino acid transport system permease protein
MPTWLLWLLGGLAVLAVVVVVAAAFLILIPEFGRDFAQYRMLLFGLAMVLVMIWRPQGLVSGREPSVRLHAERR